mgnify:CR=1 FL=1
MRMNLKSANKYNARITVVDNIKFDSAKEAQRYGELKLMERAKVISNLELQVLFNLVVNGELICGYQADFCYDENGKQVVEDVKGFRTREYVIKRRLMKAVLGITIKES